MSAIEDIQIKTRALRKELREGKKAKKELLKKIQSLEKEINIQERKKDKEQKNIEDFLAKELRKGWKALSVPQREQRNNSQAVKAMEKQQSQGQRKNTRLAQVRKFADQILAKARQELAVKQKKIKNLQREKGRLERDIRQNLAFRQREIAVGQRQNEANLREKKKRLTNIQSQLAQLKQRVVRQERRIAGLKNQDRVRESTLGKDKFSRVRQQRKMGELVREKGKIEKEIKAYQQAELKMQRAVTERLRRLENQYQQTIEPMEAKIAGHRQKIIQNDQKIQRATRELNLFLGRFRKELQSNLQDGKKDNF